MRVKPLPPTSLRLVPPSTRLPPVREQALRPGLLLRPPRPWHPRQHRRATCRRRTRRKEPARPLQVAQHAAANRGGLCNPCGLVHRVWEVNRRAHGPAVARSLTPTRFALSKRLYQPCGGPKETLVGQQLCGSAPAATAAQQALPATAWGSPTCSISRGRPVRPHEPLRGALHANGLGHVPENWARLGGAPGRRGGHLWVHFNGCVREYCNGHLRTHQH